MNHNQSADTSNRHLQFEYLESDMQKTREKEGMNRLYHDFASLNECSVFCEIEHLIDRRCKRYVPFNFFTNTVKIKKILVSNIFENIIFHNRYSFPFT